MSEIQTKILEAKDFRIARSGILPPKFAPGGQSTQMIVGATPSSDRQILATSNGLYKKFGLKRVYYSAFSPIPDSDPNLPLKSPPLIREHRLYQADWLLRFYGFKVAELTEEAAPNLDLEMDPKTAWAIRHRAFFPVDVNIADRETLLRVPGFGVRTVERIIQIRRFRKLRMEDLKKMHVPLQRAKYFVVAADSNQSAHSIDETRLELFVKSKAPEQLQLFESVQAARTGEL